MSKSRYRYRDLHWNAPWPGETGTKLTSRRKVMSAVADLQRALDKRDAERTRADVERIKARVREMGR